jgi:hypothetical protein
MPAKNSRRFIKGPVADLANQSATGITRCSAEAQPSELHRHERPRVPRSSVGLSPAGRIQQFDAERLPAPPSGRDCLTSNQRASSEFQGGSAVVQPAWDCRIHSIQVLEIGCRHLGLVGHRQSLRSDHANGWNQLSVGRPGQREPCEQEGHCGPNGPRSPRNG